jgi:hypothetical protein
MHLQSKSEFNPPSIPSLVSSASVYVGACLPLDELYRVWVAQGELLLDRHALGIDLDVASVNNFVRLHRVLVAKRIFGRQEPATNGFEVRS